MMGGTTKLLMLLLFHVAVLAQRLEFGTEYRNLIAGKRCN
jgi:hypothetical protein